MFIIPVTGLAKAAIAVTISLHPAAAHQAHQAPDHYTVKAGDTLSSIARHEYGSATAWPAPLQKRRFCSRKCITASRTTFR